MTAAYHPPAPAWTRVSPGVDPEAPANSTAIRALPLSRGEQYTLPGLTTPRNAVRGEQWLTTIDQERRYTAGWRARVNGGPVPADGFGGMGWTDCRRAMERNRE